MCRSSSRVAVAASPAVMAATISACSVTRSARRGQKDSSATMHRRVSDRERAEHPGQPLAPGALHQDLVQLQVEAGHLVPVVGRRGPQLGERPGQIGEGLRGARTGQQLGGGYLHRAPGQVQVGDVVGRQLRDEDAAGRVRFKQALLDQALEGLPDGPRLTPSWRAISTSRRA